MYDIRTHGGMYIVGTDYSMEQFGTCRLCWDLLNWLCQNSKRVLLYQLEWADNLQGSLKKTSAFWSKYRQGYHIIPFLTGTEEPFTVHATASWEAPASLVSEQLSLVSESTRLPVPQQLVDKGSEQIRSCETTIYSTQSLTRFVKFDGARRTAHPQYCRG